MIDNLSAAVGSLPPWSCPPGPVPGEDIQGSGGGQRQRQRSQQGRVEEGQLRQPRDRGRKGSQGSHQNRILPNFNLVSKWANSPVEQDLFLSLPH